jgi:hypothetical protein
MTDANSPEVDSARSKLKAELTDWDVNNIPAMFGQDRTIIMRTHEFVVERSTPLFRFFNVMHKVSLVAATIILILGMVAALLICVQLMDNLAVLHALQDQTIPGNAVQYTTP